MGESIKAERIDSLSTIGLIAPAGPLEDSLIEKAICDLKQMGFWVKEGSSLFRKHGYLAGADEERAADINSMFEDKEVQAIVCLRGGYGTLRILDSVDFKNIARNPKIIIGYSDITALLNAIYKHTGLITFHGPMATSDMFKGKDSFGMKYFESFLMKPAKQLEILNPEGMEVETVFPGKGRGKLVGGNLTMIAASIGTRYELDTKGKLLFLEDVGEEPYRIDRMLTQLKLAGKLKDIKGIVFCSFASCEAQNKSKSLGLYEVLGDLAEELKVPAVMGYMVGHCTPNITLPIGANVFFDASNKKFIIEESCVL